MKNLVEYSSSESDEGDHPKAAKSQKLPMLLPLKKKEASEDEPEEHLGRTRQFGHVEGNWATHVFIDCKS